MLNIEKYKEELENIGARLRLILRFWLEMMKVENGLKDILLDLNTEKSMRG